MPNVKKQTADGKNASANSKRDRGILTKGVRLPKAKPANRGAGSGSGRPTLYSADLCDALIESGGRGLTRAQFCAGIGISKETFYLWRDAHPDFKEAIKIYEMKLEAWYTSLIKNKMMGIQQNLTDKNGKVTGRINLDLGGLIWFGKNVVGWADKMEQKVAMGTQIVEVSKEENSLIS